MEEKDYYLAFSLVNGIGPKTFSSLLSRFGTAEKAWNSRLLELRNAGLGEKTLIVFENFKNTFDFNEYNKKLTLKKAAFVALCDKDYPKLLSQIKNPPLIIYIKGNIKNLDLEKTIGIVGTRRITNYGREVTDLFSRELSDAGFTIVSGLAMGVDSISAWAAIEAGGKTVAVLGNGVDLCFPTTNEKLYDKILEGNGALISEFPLGFSPTKGSFPSRNRIIAGLSMGVLVTEGAEDSGSLITARESFKNKRPVFAVPGPITSSLSKGPYSLIKNGAKIVVSPNDILDEFKIKKTSTRAKKLNFKGTNNELRIYKMLENEPLHFDEIVRRLRLDASQVGSLLSILEVKGFLKSSQGGYYQLA